MTLGEDLSGRGRGASAGGSGFHTFTVKDLPREPEDYRLIRIPTTLRDRAGLKGRAGSKVYIVLEVPKLDGKGRLRLRKGTELITRRKTILTHWELKNSKEDRAFTQNSVAFNDKLRRDYPKEFEAISANKKNGEPVVSLAVDPSLSAWDGFRYALICRHPDGNVNLAVLFLYLSMIPSLLFFLLDFSIEVFDVKDHVRQFFGLN